MADGERRMLFDIRGRRKHVVRVVYAILALLMGASLFLVVGPVNLGSLLSNTNETNRQHRDLRRTDRTDRTAAPPGPEQRRHPDLADPGPDQRRPRRQRSRPDDRRTDRHRQGAGGVRKGQRRLGPVSEGRQGRAEPLPRLARRGHHLPPRPELQDLRRSARIPPGTPPMPSASPRRPGPASAAGRPSPPTSTCRATRPPAPRPGRKAKALARTKSEKKAIDKQLAAFEKQSKEIQKAKKEAEKAEKGKGKEALENPLGGLGGSSGPVVAP